MNKLYPNSCKYFAVLLGGLIVSFSGLCQEKLATIPATAPVTLPATAQRYVDFYSSEQFSFSIDPDSVTIQVGPDSEIRYTLKATSKTGIVNISYEGIRCSTRQKITYAVGKNDGSWALTRSPEWSAIYINGTNIQHATLANNYFCSGTSVASKVPSIVKRIESKKSLNDPA